jgi:hypothetical protein
MASEQGKMKRNELKKWKERYTDKEQMKKFITENFRREQRAVKFVEPFADMLMQSDDYETFSGMYGTHYRWKFRYEEVLKEDMFNRNKDISAIATMSVAAKASNLDISRYVLQLKGGDKWWDWLSIRDSTIQSASLGLFTERSFVKEELIGIYVGSTNHTVSEAGGPKLSSQEIVAKELDDERGMQVRDKNGCWKVSVAKGDLKEVMLGAQFINSAVLLYKRDSNQHKRAKRMDVNCAFNDDGIVYATKLFLNGRELLAEYDHEFSY